MLARTFGCVRTVFNDAVRCWDEAYQAGEKLSLADVQRRVITEAKTREDRAWLSEVASVALVQSARDADRAYRNFFDSVSSKRRSRKVGRPRPKTRKDNRQALRLTRNGFTIRPNGRLYLAKIGDVLVRWSRVLPSAPSSVTIIREADGHYYASFVVEVEVTPLKPIEREAGIDLGILRLATVADTTGHHSVVANPRHLDSKLQKLRRLERQKARCTKGSRNRAKARRKVATAHGKVARSRLDYHHKLALALTREKPSGPRGRLVRHRNGPQPQVGAGGPRCRMGAVRSAAQGECRQVRPDRRHSVTVVAQLEDVRGLRTRHRHSAAEHQDVDMPPLRRNPRPRPQRGTQHPRRRAGGEAKRLRSPGKSTSRGGTRR